MFQYTWHFHFKKSKPTCGNVSDPSDNVTLINQFEMTCVEPNIKYICINLFPTAFHYQMCRSTMLISIRQIRKWAKSGAKTVT